MAQDKKGSDPLEGGNLRERALFWKGENPGDWLIGRLVAFGSVTLDKGPVVTASFGDCAVKPQGGNWLFARSAQVLMSAELRSRIAAGSAREIGKVFAIRFDGFEKATKDGNSDSRAYTVVEQTAARLAGILAESEA